MPIRSLRVNLFGELVPTPRLLYFFYATNCSMYSHVAHVHIRLPNMIWHFVKTTKCTKTLHFILKIIFLGKHEPLRNRTKSTAPIFFKFLLGTKSTIFREGACLSPRLSRWEEKFGTKILYVYWRNMFFFLARATITSQISSRWEEETLKCVDPLAFGTLTGAGKF